MHVVESVAVDALAGRDDQVGRRAVHAVASGDHLLARSQDIFELAFRSFGL